MSEIKLILKPATSPSPLKAEWITGTLDTPAGPVCRVSTTLTRRDFWGSFKCRISSFRDSYSVPPGLYAAGEPDIGSDIFVSANYKFSFDMLRRELGGLNAWILALDTKGINVWCAAGKGTFGTAELTRRIKAVRLDMVAGQGRLILPQLGAPGVNANEVRRATGFLKKLSYGPVRAKDIPSYVAAGYKADRQMRQVQFGLADRLVLAPMEIIPALKRYPLFAFIILALFGLGSKGIIFRDAISGGLPFLLLGLLSVLSGALLTPVLLPLIPFRSFAVKGWLMGMAVFLLSIKMVALFGPMGLIPVWAAGIFFPMASSYIALQFTGSTTFTCISGVKKELKIALPVYMASAVVSAALLAAYKLMEWRVI